MALTVADLYSVMQAMGRLMNPLMRELPFGLNELTTEVV